MSASSPQHRKSLLDARALSRSGSCFTSMPVVRCVTDAVTGSSSHSSFPRNKVLRADILRHRKLGRTRRRSRILPAVFEGPHGVGRQRRPAKPRRSSTACQGVVLLDGCASISSIPVANMPIGHCLDKRLSVWSASQSGKLPPSRFRDLTTAAV